MEATINRQKEILDQFKQIKINFDKDSTSRKTPEYINKRLEAIDNLWGEFDQNNRLLEKLEDKSQQYFTEKIYQQVLDFYKTVRDRISSYGKEEKACQPDGMVSELLTQQRTNFRALNRLIQGLNTDEMTEKWEIEDELRNLQARWNNIDNIHLQIDNILQGGDFYYDEEFSRNESTYKRIKRVLNQKLCSTAHVLHATPSLDIPLFTGKYTQWPTFFDLFVETIHNSKILSKAQKMQHLKGKVRGEAERLIQHLTISADNYDTAWEILIHRYNNPQLLFTKQIETFLNQPNISKQSSYELKRLYDTSTECIHAIHNLGVDTSTWDPLLVHLLSKKLDTATYTDFKETRKSPRDLPALDEFMEFLEAKFIALEPIHRRDRERELTPSKNYQLNQHHTKPTFNKHTEGKHFSKFYKAAPTYTTKCPLCSFDHELYRCHKFVSMTAEAKLRTVSRFNICQNCLYKHTDKCHSAKRCKECNADHNTLLHEVFAQSNHTATKPSNAIATYSSSKSINSPHSVNHVAANDEEVLLTTLSLKVKAADGSFITLRALLDQGSQIALISENAAQLLGLQRRRYNASVSGIGNGSKTSKGVVSIQCQSIYGDYTFSTQALVISHVINNLPNSSFSKQTWPHLQHIDLADPDYNVSKPIDILLDASVYSEIIMSGLIKGPSQAPIAQQTKVGWILSGAVKTYNCHVVINNLQDIAKYWELEDINDNCSDLTREEQFCEDFYQATTERLDNGRYVVALPMKPGYEEGLGMSKPKAVAQFNQLEHKMLKNCSFSSSYKQFIDEYQQLGHMRRAKSDEGPSCFLPHHGVFKLDSSTTRLRVVFNGSSKTTSGQSLNDLMECGPNLQVDLHDLILRWRQHKYVITADIEKMFRQVLIRESDQPLQSIIWRDSPTEPLCEYRLTTVTYGTKAAPFLAMRTLRQLAKDDAAKYPLAAAALENSFFTDDLLSGHDSIKSTKELQRQLIAILEGAGMNLRKWSANTKELVAELPSTQVDVPFDFKCAESRKTLGLRWHPSTDHFTFQSKIEYKETSHTKRQLLSEISKIFDPLGWLSPITVKAKLLFQKAWTSGISWDDKLTKQLQDEWIQLRDDLEGISQFSVPRYLGNTQTTFQIHGFCDASEKAYACAIYLVAYNDKGAATSTLVIAKTKLAPQNKQLSLPRLELCGAQLLSTVMKKVMQTFSKEQLPSVQAWTDSMVTLGWIHGDITRWKQFVANRVNKIRDIIPASQWNHVRSEDNPADSATRGSKVKILLDNSLWWQGPKWLLTFDPSNIDSTKYQSPDIETKQARVNTALCDDKQVTLITELLHNNHSITRVVKTIAWVSRFVARLRHLTSEQGKVLSPAEIENAYKIIIKLTQNRDFEDELNQLKSKGHVRPNSKLAGLCPILDEDGIMRVGGRLNYSSLSSSAKHPIIISHHSRFTDLIIHQAHITTLHGGPRLTLSYIREKYWVISGMNTIKRQIRLCVICRRYSAERREQIMADLPSPRVTPSRPFTHTGVDFTGHVDLKASKGRGIRCHKGYIAIFVCLATKAVHLELVSDLSTPAFLAAFRRFCARRGTPSHMYSDNGTNFVGSDRLLKKEYKEIIANINHEFFNNIAGWNINWSFNSPAWPTAGGLWESAVKSFKHHLKRTLGEQKLTYEEFTTLIQQIEACLNSRPLFPLTENPEDDYLTPGHFLVGGSLLSRPQGDDSMNLPCRWQMIQCMTKVFWKKWSTDYLQQLQSRSKWRKPSKNIDIDDIVLIKDDNLPPGKWVMGRVHEVHPGKDGYVRVVSLKTQNSILKRPITKLVLLPIQNESVKPNQGQQENKQVAKDQGKTRRNIKPVKFKNMFVTSLLFLAMLFSPTLQQEQKPYMVTQIEEKKGLYFDKMSNLQYIRDEWKLVVYYNLTTYHKGLTDISTYLEHLKKSLVEQPDQPQYNTLIIQLDHELNEIQHYDTLLQGQYRSRQKRGLINGVGYAANALFGVLDERFAEQYAKDIELIVHNEKHLQRLIRNQTIVLEAEANIMKRNEEIMNAQFETIGKHLHNLSDEVNHVRLEVHNGLYVTSSALVANIILNNLRRMQETLINTITDTMNGHIDSHILLPEQLEYQILTISSQLQGDLTMPVEQSNFADIYKMLKVSSRLFSNYLIIELKIPLVSKEAYELVRVISIPQNKNQHTYYIIPSHPYLAFNLRKDTVMFLFEHDISQCLHATEDKILCSLDKPIYNIKLKDSICQLNINNAFTKTAPCEYRQTNCDNRWIKLHARNDWLFSCCQECRARIFCPSGVSMLSLSGNGLVTLGHGCVLKDNDLTIYTHNNYMNRMTVHSDIKVPELSILNNLINTTITDDLIPENHTHMWKQLQEQIENIKGQSYLDYSIHDVHHYTATYTILAILLIIASTVAYWKLRRICQRQAAAPAMPPATTAVVISPGPARSVEDVPSVNASVANERNLLRKTVSCVSVDQGTSPLTSRSVSFHVPSVESRE